MIIKSKIVDAPVYPKVWGSETWLENNDKYCCKILSINKGYYCSLHYHKIKDEMFIVQYGEILLKLGTPISGQIINMRKGDYVRIIPYQVHQFTAIEDSAILEVSTHHDEDDSYRLEPSGKVS
jgi:mannose-6-phosphate isomerase-like protein (cupin superfamily)